MHFILLIVLIYASTTSNICIPFFYGRIITVGPHPALDPVDLGKHRVHNSSSYCWRGGFSVSGGKCGESPLGGDYHVTGLNINMSH